jgi:hypothetical protein
MSYTIDKGSGVCRQRKAGIKTAALAIGDPNIVPGGSKIGKTTGGSGYTIYIK